MPYVPFNNNPRNIRVGDCAVRAVSIALGKSWEDTYSHLCAEGLFYHDMPSANYVWGMYLKSTGFEQKVRPSVCPMCVTVSQFTEEHPEGTYVLATENHVVTAVDGSYYDSWDSGDEVVLYYFEKEI